MTDTGKSGVSPKQVLSSEEAQRLFQASVENPHEGRVYDAYLGGCHNFAADREFARRQIARVPDLPRAARANRNFLTRAVQYMINNGIDQFVDIGSGLPTQGNVHEVAAQASPDTPCTVVYVDHDPVASAHSYLLLEQTGQLDRAQPITGELLDTAPLWETILASGLIDPHRPVGLLMVAVLHFVNDDAQANAAVDFYRQQVVRGSFLAISHASTDGMPEEHRAALTDVGKQYDAQTTTKLALRDRAHVAGFFRDWAVEEPGIVWTPEWFPPGFDGALMLGTEPSPSGWDAWRSQIVAGLARKL